MADARTQFRVGDRVRTEDGEGEILSVKDGVFEVGIAGENDWFYSDSEIELVEEQPNRTYYEAQDRDYDQEEPPLAPWERGLIGTPFEQNVHRHLNKIADILIAKNKAYGDSALNPIRAFSKASRIEQLNVRIDDKISRVQRGTDFEDEDTVRDLIGYLVLRLIAEESE
jgi:hypothetical protein